MSRLMRGLTLLCVYLFPISAALPVLAQVSQTNTSAASKQTNRDSEQPVHGLQHGVVWMDSNPLGRGPIGFAAPAGAHLTYFGGPVISNAHVVEVLYGSGSYLPQVSSTAAPSIASFFSDLLGASSGYISLLTQYSTPASGGTNQTIGNGVFDGLFQIVPSAANNGSTIDDSNIQAELLAQISAGHLPAPVLDPAGNINTLYMIYFPPGKTITLQGSSSCVAGGFCAYHSTTSNTLNSKNILYGVMPDLQAGSGCSSGCGASSVFGNYTSVTSHELSEAITDADVGIATTFAAPLAWMDMKNGEIGDICNAQQGSYTANGTAYTIQLEFSNAANNCVLPPAAPPAVDFRLSASPGSLGVTQGSSASSMITVTPSGGFTGSVSLSTSALPSGVTAAFGTNPATSTSTVTFSASGAATTGTSQVTITGTSGNLSHNTTVSLTVDVMTTISVSPSFLSFGSRLEGDPPISNKVTLTNNGSATASFTSISLQNGFAGFRVGNNACGSTLAAGASCTVTVTFAAGNAPLGTATDTLLIADDVPGSPQKVSLSAAVRCPSGGCL